MGAAIGATLSCTLFFNLASLIQHLTFRYTFILTDLLGVLSTATSLWLNLYCLSACRFIFGLLVGINSAITIQYVYHIAPSSRRGFYGGIAPILMMIGLTLGFGLQWAFLSPNPSSYNASLDYGIFGFSNWRLIFGFPLITFSLRLLAFSIFYRTHLPTEYLQLGQKNQALRILENQYEY